MEGAGEVDAAHSFYRSVSAVSEDSGIQKLSGWIPVATTSATPIVGMVEHRGRLFVAMTNAVFERGDDGVFRECKFEMVP